MHRISPRQALVVALLLVSAGASAGPVQNGSFKQQLQSWSPVGKQNGALMAFITDPAGIALRITNRTGIGDGVRQNIAAGLTAAGSGVPYTLRFETQVDAFASVRAILLLTVGTETRRVLLAERMFHTSGPQYVPVEGHSVVTWSGAISAAWLTFEIGDAPAGSFTNCAIRNIQLELDTDGDRLFDAEEVALGTSPTVADSDGDSAADGLERQLGLNPTFADLDDDPDADGFTSREEVAAATSPLHAGSSPGQPSNDDAGPAARAVLRWLATLPARSGERVVLGQHLTEVVPEFPVQVQALPAATGHQVAALGLQYELNAVPCQASVVNPYAISWWQGGGLVQIKWSAPNPWTGGTNGDLTGPIDLMELVTPGTPANATWMGWLDCLADGLEELRDAGVVVLWRPMSEMNGAWFWFGHRRNAHYVAVWRHMHQYFSQDRGLDNLLWTYESDSAVHPHLASDYYYPGDSYVDVMGHNLYHDEWALPFEAERLYRDYPKVYGFPQAGSRNVRDGTWDNLVMIEGVKARYPRASWVMAWNTFPGKTTQWNYNAIIHNQNATALLSDPWAVTLAKVDWAAASCGDGVQDDWEACDPTVTATCCDGSCALAAACDDGDLCTSGDTCSAGSCQGTPFLCSDNDACTADACDPAVGCVYSAVTCDDDDACTADACDTALGCVTAAIDCDDTDACTADACDTATGCVNAAVSCDDADACTADACDTATGCVNATVSCDDADACTTDACDPDAGCVNAPVSCDDGDACTTDACDPDAGCVNAAVSCNDGDACTTDACDPDAGCVHEDACPPPPPVDESPGGAEDVGGDEDVAGGDPDAVSGPGDAEDPDASTPDAAPGDPDAGGEASADSGSSSGGPTEPPDASASGGDAADVGPNAGGPHSASPPSGGCSLSGRWKAGGVSAWLATALACLRLLRSMHSPGNDPKKAQ